MGDPTLIDDANAGRLSPKVIGLWRLNLLLWTAFIAGAAGAVGWMLDLRTPGSVVAGAAAVAGMVTAILLPPAQYRSWLFAVGDSDVVIRRGAWWRVTSIVPHSRIQHVDTTHGPLERKLGLSSVVLFTAGTVGASITIPGLPSDQANELRDRLAALGRTGESV